MPLALALLLLVGLSGGWGCLQCDHSVQEMLRQLRLHLISSSFGREQLRARAQALLLGMEGPFFRDYATNVFVGKIEMYHLDLVAIFAKNQINKLRVDSLRETSHCLNSSGCAAANLSWFVMTTTTVPETDGPLLGELVTLRRKVTKKLKTGLRSYELKACDRKLCYKLTEEVLDCLRCLKTSPKCIKKNSCFVDRQPRRALQYGTERGRPQDQVQLGIIVSVGLAVFAFGVIVASAVTYRHNRKLLLQ